MKGWIDGALAYFFAVWHLRRPPLVEADAVSRAQWCRDHCGSFAARWFALGAGLWFLFSTPFVQSGWIGVVAVFGLAMGMWHIGWQILAQRKAGPPPIEPPVEFPDRPQNGHDPESSDNDDSPRRR
jgi:hypothetical protein